MRMNRELLPEIQNERRNCLEPIIHVCRRVVEQSRASLPDNTI